MAASALPIISLPIELSGSVPSWYENDPRDWHRFEIAARTYLLVADRSRIYEVDSAALADALAGVGGATSVPADTVLAAMGIWDTAAVDNRPPEMPPLRSLSLAVAQKCNLSCSYCYAQQGEFGGPPQIMSLKVAIDAVRRLFDDACPGDRVHLSFLGGEPLLARDVVRAAAQQAVEIGQNRGVSVGLSITTNGTLLTPADADFFDDYGFAVTVSIDGIGETHDRLRPFHSGRGTFHQILRNIRSLLGRPGRMQVSARVTVTPTNLELPQTLEALIGLGFYSVGFSPMLASPTGRNEMGSASLATMLDQMVDCGREFERRITAGQRYPFSNMALAMRALHRGTHRPYPCGAGAGYFGVSADGDLFACHRFVGDEDAKLGSISAGVDRDRQSRWLHERHVLGQQPCTSCWARFLCGGGCHHEVLRRGRPACDYIRGWLHYCLQAYVRLSTARPDYFGDHSAEDA